MNITNTDIQWILDEFFNKDKQLTSNSLIRNSVLLSAIRDIGFLRGVFLDSPKLSLNDKQKKLISTELPSLAAILVFCSVVDLLGRIAKGQKDIFIGKGKTKRRRNDIFFKRSCTRWFNLSKAKSDALWQFRNSLSHQYIVLPNTRTYPHGFSGIMQYNKSQRVWEYNLNGMYTSLQQASINIKKYIVALSEKGQIKRVGFIYKYGFIYTPVI